MCRLLRALLSPLAVPARQRYKRLQRLLDSPWLTPTWLTLSEARRIRDAEEREVHLIAI